jgi:starch phosphorylase
LSVLDGWWDEGYEREIGWAIGNGEEFEDHGFQDELESRALYDILEKDIIPIFYERGPDGLPRRWVAMMKASMNKLCPVFNTHRMVSEYWDRFYLPAAERGFQLTEKDGEGLRRLAKWREKVMYNWASLAIRQIRMTPLSEIEAGAPYPVEADVFLGDLLPEDVMVEAYAGRVDSSERFMDRFTQIMDPLKKVEEKVYTYRCAVSFQDAGHFGINVRITPKHPNAESRHSMGLVLWGQR